MVVINSMVWSMTYCITIPFQEDLTSLEDALSGLEATWSSSPDLEYTSVEQARDHLLTTQEFVHGLSRHQPHLQSLAEQARALQGRADPPSRAEVGAQVDGLNKRWSLLNTEATQRMGQLKVGGGDR